MKKTTVLFPLFLLALFLGFRSNSFAQSQPVLYFCERYDETTGEVNISDRFYSGYLTVMVKADKPLGLSNCSIQYDRYNPSTGTFSFYKKFKYTVQPTMKYIYFSKNEESSLAFEDSGIFRVFLLDGANKTVASALIEILK